MTSFYILVNIEKDLKSFENIIMENGANAPFSIIFLNI